MNEHHLLSHPDTPCPAIRKFNVRVERKSADRLALYYYIEGDIDVILTPAQHRSARGEDLWKTTCFEAFVRPRGGARYLEFNFSPSSEWAVYEFDDYRRGMRPVDPATPPKIICRRGDGNLVADVDVHLEGLNVDSTSELELGLAAVIEHQDGALSYWSLAHPEGKPDFHHASAFAATLSAGKHA